MIDVDTSSFFAIVVVAALAATTVAVLPRRLAPPVVVVELMLGILIGPQVLDIARSDDFIEGHYALFFFGIIFPVLWIVGALLGPTPRAEATGTS
jgi:Kef-type K+ transport system membrane component KefB